MQQEETNIPNQGENQQDTPTAAEGTPTEAKVEAPTESGTAEEIFTQERVNEIVQERLKRDRESFLTRYGFKSEDDIKALTEKVGDYDRIKAENEELATANRKLTEESLFRKLRISPSREEDVRLHFKGLGKAITEEDLAKTLETHREWAEAGQKEESVKARPIGATRHESVGKTDEEKALELFGFDKFAK